MTTDAAPERSSTPSLADVTPFAAVVTALGAVTDAPPTRRSRRAVAGEQTPAEAQDAAAAPTSEGPSDPLPQEPVAPEGQAAPTAEEIDAFEAAARLFSFTGETPIQNSSVDEDSEPAVEGGEESPRDRGASFKRVTATSFTVGVMGIVGLLTVGLTTPADAVAAPGATDISSSMISAQTGESSSASGEEIQAYVTPSEVQNAAIDRPENYSTLTMAQLASESGIANYSNFFVNNPNSPIQWPFAVGVPISYGFGMRDGSMHEGADFTPGEGAPIQAIADGVVRESTESGGAFGVHIVIDHVIDGQLISSSYSHMLYGSRQVQVGDHVTVGTIIGHTGDTGRSYGAHTHFEMLANGTTPIDPIPWLREHAGG